MDCSIFKKITEAYEQTEKILVDNEKQKQIISETFGDSSSNPVDNYYFEKPIKDQKQKLISYVATQLQENYPNIAMDDVRFQRLGNAMLVFDAVFLAQFIVKEYEYADVIALQQMQTIIKKDLFHSKVGTSPDDVKRINKTGLEFYAYGRESQTFKEINALVKFSKVILGGADPLIVPGISNIEIQCPYEIPEAHILSLVHYGNSNLKIKYASEEDRERIAQAIFEDPAVLLGKQVPKQSELTIPCDICLVKGFNCESCTDFSQWQGDCKYCHWNNRDNCEKCKILYMDFFGINGVKKSSMISTFLKNRN